MRVSIIDLLFGKPLSTSEERGERLGPLAGTPVFGLDALSSAAYGPEAALALLIVLGSGGIRYTLPITICIVVLLTIVYFSYRQTIDAYPNGGGSYTVAGQNLGSFAGLLAAAALMVDYILTAAVGISAGVGAIVSAFPSLEPHTLSLCIGILVVVTLINLRGLRQAGALFMAPTYLFVASLALMIGIGLWKAAASGGHPAAVIAPPALPRATEIAGVWLLLKAFASGCTAMTGVEAVSNGVSAFRKPVSKNAKLTLTIIIVILIVLLLGIALLCRAYQIGATQPGPGYQSVLSQLLLAVAGRGVFYYVSIAGILLVLALSANTAFADFPRLCRLVAEDSYLPSPFAVRGRRLVYTFGIVVLALLAGALLIAFQGVTDRLIPLYAIGAFLAFTLSQAGMVEHWRKNPGPGSRFAMALNATGAICTAATVLIVAVTKFTEGAWVTILVIPTIIVGMYAVHRHYAKLQAQLENPAPLEVRRVKPPMVVVPMISLNKVVRRGLEFALNMSDDVHVVHVNAGEREEKEVRRQWNEIVADPMRNVGMPVPHLNIVKSPYRFVIQPIVDYVLELARRHPGRQIAVIIPEYIERRWYWYVLHNQRAAWLKAALLFKGNRQIVVINVPWYVK